MGIFRACWTPQARTTFVGCRRIVITPNTGGSAQHSYALGLRDFFAMTFRAKFCSPSPRLTTRRLPSSCARTGFTTEPDPAQRPPCRELSAQFGDPHQVHSIGDRHLCMLAVAHIAAECAGSALPPHRIASARHVGLTLIGLPQTHRASRWLAFQGLPSAYVEKLCRFFLRRRLHQLLHGAV